MLILHKMCRTLLLSCDMQSMSRYDFVRVNYLFVTSSDDINKVYAYVESHTIENSMSFMPIDRYYVRGAVSWY